MTTSAPAGTWAVYFLPGINGNEWAMLGELGLDHSLVMALWQDAQRAPLLVFVNPGDSGGHGAAERMLADELTTYVEHTFHTRSDPASRALKGCWVARRRSRRSLGAARRSRAR